MGFWEALQSLQTGPLIIFLIALAVAFGFEFINGFHDTANAVTTVIYTRTMSATPAVLYSGFMNFLGALVMVLWFGAGVAFGIVNLLPVDILVNAKSTVALIAVLSLLITGVFWNLSTWYLGLPVSSSHTLIGSILGAGLASSLLGEKGSIDGVNWDKAAMTFLFLFISPLVGFICAAILLLIMKRVAKDPRLYTPPVGDERPPGWIRGVLIGTCGGVSFMHGSNDGQKGMGLLLLILIGFLPFYYCLDGDSHRKLPAVRSALDEIKDIKLPDGDGKDPKPSEDIAFLRKELEGKAKFDDLPPNEARWEVRQAIFRLARSLKKNPDALKAVISDEEKRKKIVKSFNAPIEYVPIWVIVGTALALGVGTTIGYKRIVVTVAEKIGKTHLTYGQGAAAEAVAAMTIAAADALSAPVSTTQILSSGVAGTMVANKSGVQMATARKILLAWVLTLPCTTIMAGVMFWIGKCLFTG